MGNIMEGEKPQQKTQIAIMQEDEDGISVPNWLVEVLAWITRIEMANSSLSYSCKLFKELCWPKLHGNVEPHKITKLEYRPAWLVNSGYLFLNGHYLPLPVPIVPSPSYILGFNTINIEILDAGLLEFFQNIFPRLNQITFSMGFGLKGWRLNDKKTKTMRQILDLLASKIVKFTFHNISEFNQLFPGFIHKVDYLYACPIPAEFKILFDWLALPVINGEKQQKILELGQMEAKDTNKFIDRIKKEFSNAKKQLNFFIICPIVSIVTNFNMENKKTGEILTLYQAERMELFNFYNVIIVRCPKGEENYWSKEGERKIKLNESLELEDTNETYIRAQIIYFED